MHTAVHALACQHEREQHRDLRLNGHFHEGGLRHEHTNQETDTVSSRRG